MPRKQTREGDQDWNRLDRRRMLQGVGAGALVSFAGCSGGDGNDGSDGGDGNDSDGGDGGDSTVQRTWIGLGGRTPPPDLQYNPINPKNYGGAVGQIVYSSFFQFSTLNSSFRNDVVEEISFSEDSFTMSLADHTWHNGDPVTAEDAYTRLKLAEFTGGSIWNYLESLETSGEKTLEGTFTSTVNEVVFKLLLSTYRMSTPNSGKYGDILTTLEEASSDSERESAKQELLEYAPSEPMGSGPFAFKSADGQGIYLERFDDHPAAGDLNFPKVTVTYVGEKDQQRWAATSSSKIDQGAAGTPREIMQGFPDHYMVIRRRRYGDISMLFNYDHKWLGRRKVRQALAYITDRKQAVENQGQPDKIHMDFPLAGMFGSADYQREWIGDLQDKLTRYEPTEEGLQTATSLLEEEGFSKNGDTWMTPDGNPFTLTYIAPACCNAWITMMQTAANNAQDFGIQAEFTAVNTSNLFATKQPQGNFDVGTALPGGFPNPFFAYRQWFPAVGGRAWSNSQTSVPDEVEVPMPIGDSDGSLEKVSWKEPLNTLGATSGEEAKKAVRKLAWIWNQSLPGYAITDKAAPEWINAQGWQVPDEDKPRNDLHEVQEITDPDLKPALASSGIGRWLLHQGKIQADPDESLPR